MFKNIFAKTKTNLMAAKMIVIDAVSIRHMRMEKSTDMLLVDSVAKYGFDYYDKFFPFYDQNGDFIVLAWKATPWDRFKTKVFYFLIGHKVPIASKDI